MIQIISIKFMQYDLFFHKFGFNIFVMRDFSRSFIVPIDLFLVQVPWRSETCCRTNSGDRFSRQSAVTSRSSKFNSKVL